MATQCGNSATGDMATTQTSRRDTNKPDDAPQKLSAMRKFFLLFAVFMSMFLVGLDRTIISTV